jgi:GNAT superfamily N-acetyltransferase
MPATSRAGASAPAVVREANADDWARLRDIRLTALSEAPSVFGSSYAREVAFTERDWRGRLTGRSATFFGYPGPAPAASSAVPASLDGPPLPDESAPRGDPAGLAGVVIIEDGSADLVSMYVRSSARGQGIGEALIGAAIAWAGSHGHRALFLWVTESNAPARLLYERHGFTPTGERQPLPSDPTIPEIRMSRVI